MTRSNYKAQIHGGTPVMLVIEDLNQGGMSVTNDIENVIAEICSRNNLENELAHNQVGVVYRDSEGTWDGFTTKNNSFVHLGAKTQEEATHKYLHQWQTKQI